MAIDVRSAIHQALWFRRTLPKLDQRLTAVADQILSNTHVDVGSDHGHLLVSLLTSGRIQRGIAIEDKPSPFAKSKAALLGLNAEVRLGDGLAVFKPNEADSLSICGMGGESMVRILEAFPNRVPPIVVLQPNRRPELIRRWAQRCGFHLTHEQVLSGRCPYCILVFEQAGDCNDPAYEGVEMESGLLFGPLILKRRSPEFISMLRAEQKELSKHPQLCPASQRRLAIIDRLLVTETPLHPSSIIRPADCTTRA